MSITTISLYIAGLVIVAAVLNLGGWWLTLQIMDRLTAKLNFERFVAVRHLRGRKSGFLTAIGVLSIFGVSVSSCTLTTVLSVMGGFSGDLKQKIFTTNSHVLVDQYGADMEKWEGTLKKVEQVDGVVAATPIIHHDMMVTSSSNSMPVKFIGMDIDSFSKVSHSLDKLEQGDVKYLKNPGSLFEKVRKKRETNYGLGKTPGKIGIDREAVAEVKPLPPVSPRQKVLPVLIVGREISKTLRLYEGLEVNVINPVGGIGPTGIIPKSKPFRVGGIFFSGMFEFDNFFVYTSLTAAQKYLNRPGVITEIQVAVKNPDNAVKIASEMSEVLGEKYRVRSWADLNAPLFSALKLEKIVMFIILSLITLVASFCIVATLTMLVLEKSAEVSVMMTLGASTSDIKSIFRFEGFLIGVVGTASGLLIGFMLCMFLERVGLPLDPEVWYIDKLPVNMEWLEFSIVAAASMTITQLAAFYPARIAANLTPVEGLKNE